MHQTPGRLLQRFARKIKKLFTRSPENPDDPYALVTAPVLPRPPKLSATAAAVPERYDSY